MHIYPRSFQLHNSTYTVELRWQTANCVSTQPHHKFSRKRFNYKSKAQNICCGHCKNIKALLRSFWFRLVVYKNDALSGLFVGSCVIVASEWKKQIKFLMILLLMDMKKWIFLAFYTSLYEMITPCAELACAQQIQKIYFYEKLIHRMHSSVVK